MAERKNATATVTVNGSVITYTWADGAPATVVDCSKFAPEIMAYAAIHGIKQKLGDATALPIENVNGKMVRPSIGEKRSALLEVLANISAGVWNAPRGTGESGGMLYRAVKEHFTAADGSVPERVASVESFRAWIDERAMALKTSKASVENSLRKNPRIAALLERMREEAGRNLPDSEDLLDDLANS